MAVETDVSVERGSAFEETADRSGVAGIGPWRLGARRLRRNKTALAFGAVFVLLVAVCLAAPLWADHVAKTSPDDNHLSDTIKVDGKTTNVVALDGVPIGPTYQGQFFLGADRNGRDVLVRLLYGGRNSLMIAFAASTMTMLLSVALGVLAGYLRGRTDVGIRSFLDILWSFPVIVLGVALGVALALGGLRIGPIHIAGDSLWIPVLVIGVVYVPYMARPVRGQVLSLREKEFVEAAEAQGAGPLRIMVSEILPNLSSTILVFFPLLVANAVLLESALSYLGAGVRPPNPSWGTMIDDGIDRIATAPHLTVVPGLMLVLTVLSLNIFGDGVRDALDPRAKVRIEH
jgi:peptide/nickel transport system permease protein